MANYPRPGVYVTESLLPSTRIQNAATANAAGAAVGTFPKGPTDLTLVQSWYDFTTMFGGLDTAFPSTYSVQSYFQNGGRDLYVVRMLSADAAKASAVIVKDGLLTAAVTLTARNKGTQGNSLSVTVSAGTGANLYDVAISESVVGVSGLVPREYFSDLNSTVGSNSNIATVLNSDSAYVTAVVNDAAAAWDLGVVPFTTGSNGSAITKSDYVPVSGDSVFAALSLAARPLVLFLPSLHTDVTVSADRGEVYGAAVEWASANYGFVVVDTPKGLSASMAVTYKAEIGDTSYAAEYWPNVVIPDPLGRSKTSVRSLAPSGAVAGLYLNTDVARGVFKTPAGLEASLNNVVALEVPLTGTDLNTLHAGGVNAIRNVPGAGLVVMGGKTTKAARTADQNVNVRRSLSYLEKSLTDITEFAIFENNNSSLWARINTVCTVFLGNFWRAGGLAGATEAQAFYVKCDAENNTVTSVQNGEVNIEVGVSLQYPAEFIVIRLSQQA